MTQSKAPLVENGFATPIFADELSAIVPDGTVTYLIFSARQPRTDGAMERVIQYRLIVLTDRLQLIGRTLLSGRLDLSPEEESESVTLQ